VLIRAKKMQSAIRDLRDENIKWSQKKGGGIVFTYPA
jgi:hypothetical protein